ncbi:hypothetical protein TrST_g9603 [Triparma strigata]|uniref:Uncharacterized protein n=1 Tax=Triparma strigata TaxID=1606541 RepID=A0A9W6ZP70_9STRA|nr:hypothetical protein TrST_g9603 [Triparma strigata]
MLTEEKKTTNTFDASAGKVNKKGHSAGLVRRTVMNLPRFSFKREKDWIKKGHIEASSNVASNVKKKLQKSASDVQPTGPRARQAANMPSEEELSRRKTVVGIGKAKKFVVDGTGRGLPIRAFPDAATRRTLLMYCSRNGITQKMLEQLYDSHKEVIEGRYHYDGTKKKWYDYSVDSSLDIFEGHRVEMIAFVVLSHAFFKEYPGLPPHDGKDHRGISFARYVIWSCEICRLKDYEMIDLFMKCLTQKPNIEPNYFMNEGMLPPFFEAIHRNFRSDKYLRYLVDELLPIKEGEDMGLTLTELIRYAYKYPVLLFPIFDFQKMWRRKMFGEHFWSERVFEAHERPEEYEDARSKYGISSEDFNLFARLPTTKSAWTHTARNVTLDLLAERSRNKIAPPWKLVSKIIASRILKDRFGYQNSYFFLKLLDMREDFIIEKEEEIKAQALEDGELSYDEWLKNEFYHNPITGISKWDNSYKKGATDGVEFSLDMEMGPGGDGGGRRGSILKTKGEDGEGEDGEELEDDYDYEAEQERRRRKKERKRRKKKERREREQLEREGLAKEEGEEEEEKAPPEQDHHESHLLQEDRQGSGLHQFDRNKRRGGVENVLMAAHEDDEEATLDEIDTGFALLARRQQLENATYEVHHEGVSDLIKQTKSRKDDSLIVKTEE